MGYIILAYATDGYQEYILPESNDINHEILLKREYFGLRDNLTVLLDNIDGIWRFVESSNYELLNSDGQHAFGDVLTDGAVFKLLKQNRQITMVILQTTGAFASFHKYSLKYVKQVTIGKDASNMVVYDFLGYISRNHVILYEYEGRWLVKDNSSNGTYLNHKRVTDQAYLQFGDEISFFGLKIIFLNDVIAMLTLEGEYKVNDLNLADYHPRENLVLPEQSGEIEKKVYFKRAPRTVESLFTDSIEIEAPPQQNTLPKRPLLLTIGPSFTMAIPMMLGCLMAFLSARSRGGGTGLYMFTGLVTAISSAIIGVAWALINLKYSGKEQEEQETLRFNAYSQYLINITDKTKEKYNLNREILFKTYLSGKECCGFTKKDSRLWNHNERQSDFLVVRMGLATIPFQGNIQVPKERFSLKKDELAGKPATIHDSYEYLYQVPFCLDIWKKGIVGIIGGSGKKGAYPVVYNMIAQLAANVCYTDLKMIFICGKTPDAMAKWGFAKWLPHVWTDDKKTRMIAGDKDELGDILYELSGILRKRTEEQNSRKEYPIPHYVLFIDDTELLQGELLEKLIYDPRPEYGMTTILLTERYEDLPNSCEEIIQNNEAGQQIFHVVNSEEHSRDLQLEGVSEAELDCLARKLCDIEVNESTENGEIPNALDFFEMYGVGTLDQLKVLERWKKNRNYENMRVPIGAKNGGYPCYLDIHEKYHGPHGLIAGTTGSGKSETLQTYILSLAVNFSPDDIAFFIIDFKGGGMANLFSDLPHMAGQISNLSGNQVRRAMISIKSENLRRQRVFAEHNVNNINLYTKLFKNHEAKEPVPHLFIIIDEFAELKREEPEFMKELISVAQVGRSLGVHLILATQKPSGTVDDNIWSNSKFRLCLRVQDKQDSNDMLHKVDAAYITQAGRGYLQVGNDEIYEQFQSGYSGAEYVDDPSLNKAAVAMMMSLTGKELYSGSTVRRKKASSNTNPQTQLDAVIEYLRMQADKYQYDRRMTLWLPVLPENLYLEELDGFSENLYRGGMWPTHQGEWLLETEIGKYDDPANQAQNPLKINFSEGGNLGIFGMVSTGKSTFLQTLLYALIQKYSPNELNFYVLDYSSRMLLPFENAPHCGGVIIDTDMDKVQKFFFMINSIMEERKTLFKGGNYAQYQKAMRGKSELPAIVIAVDNYANFREKTGNKYDEQMIRISREGVGYGIYLVLTAAGLGANEIPTRVGDNLRTVISLEMSDKFKYAEVLHTTRVEIMPEAEVKGRGLAYVHGNILEFQTALPLEAEDAYAVSASIEAICEDMRNNWKGRGARRIPVIPENPVFGQLAATEEYQHLLTQECCLPFAYDAKDASTYALNLLNTYCYIIQGRSRTGKTNVLKLLMYAAAQNEKAEIVLIEQSGEELKSIAKQLQITYLRDETEIFEYFKNSIPLFKERNAKKRQKLELGMEAEEIAAEMIAEKPVFIFVADYVNFIRSAYTPKEGVGNIYAYLENITEKGSSHGFYFIGCLNPETITSVSGYQIYINISSYKTGIHLGGNSSGQRLFQFSNIPFQEQGKTSKPGVGLVPAKDDPGQAERVVIPLVKGGFT